MSGRHAAPRRRLAAPALRAQASTTLVEPPAVQDGSAATVAAAPTVTGRASERAARPSRRGGAERDSGLWFASTALMVLAALMLGFVAQVVVVSRVLAARDQDVLLSDFRSDLANAVAPTGQFDADNHLLGLGTPVAVLAIPALGVTQVVVEGTASGQTMSGPGHRRDTPLPGQPGTSVVFGRQASYGGPFGRINTLVAGDEIVVTTAQGEQRFTVTDVRHPGDPLPAPLKAGGSRLTLVTADGTPYLPSDVLRVDAALTSPVQPGSMKVLGASALDPAEAAMAGDPSAWIGVVLWAQALLLVALGVTWARTRWGRWQAWVIGVPLLGFLGLALAGQVVRLLPNLM